MSMSAKQLDASHILECVLKALLTQIATGMSFEHARGAFRDIAMQLGFAPNAPVIKKSDYALYLAWQTRRLKEIGDLVEQGFLPLSSPDPESSMVWDDDLLPKSRFSADGNL